MFFGSRHILQNVSRSSRLISQRWQSSLVGRLTFNDMIELPSTPSVSPSYPHGPYRFVNREYFIVTYETDPQALRDFVPYPLVPNEKNHVLYEWIAMPDSSGFGNYQESGIVIPCTYKGEEINYVGAMLLDCEPPIACGREIWGFPKKRANPKLVVEGDTLLGTVDYANQQIAFGTMSFKYNKIDPNIALQSLMKPSCNLKIIPEPESATQSLGQLIKFTLQDVEIKGAWYGPARLHLQHSAAAPVADLPVRKIVGGKHILANLTLPAGNILYDYHSAETKANIEKLRENPTPQNQAEVAAYEKIVKIPSMPAYAPSFPQITPNFVNETLLIIYETDPELILPHLPEDLELVDNKLVFQVSNTEGTGVGAYSRAQLHVPCRLRNATGNFKAGDTFLYSLIVILDCSASITFGRERYGKPSKYGFPSLSVNKDTLVCSVKYGDQEIVRGSMLFKNTRTPPTDTYPTYVLSMTEMNLKIIPHASGSHSVCKLVAVKNGVHDVEEVYEGKAALDFIPHVHAPFADFPINKIVKSYHLKTTSKSHHAVTVKDYLLPTE